MPRFRDLTAALRLLADGADRSVAWRLGASSLLAICAGALAGVAPLALKEMVDAAGSNGKASWVSFATLGAAYLCCLGVGRLLTEIRPVLMSAAEQRLYARLRSRYFKHLLDLPLAYHLDRRTGALVHGLQQAISGYQIIVFHAVNSVAPVLVESATVAAVLLSLGQPALTLTFVATALAYFVLMGRGTAGLNRAAQAVSDASSDSHAKLTDGLLNYEPIKCFGAERSTLESYDRSSRSLEHCWANLQRQRCKLGLAVTAVFALSMTASLALATKEVASGALTVGGFVLANLYMLQVIRPLESLSAAVRDVFQGLAFIRPLLGVLDATPEPLPGGPPIKLGDASAGRRAPAEPRRRFPPQVSFRSVRLAFDAGEPILDGFNLDMPPGGSTAIVGASGCGKSSLVRLLLRLREPAGGSILLDGVDIGTLPIASLRALIAVVPQDVVLFNMTIAANIGFARDDSTQAEIERAAQLAGLHGFIATLPRGYDTMIGERGLKLSGGERQRIAIAIAIARAILKDPQVFVFDEATSMLDGPTERAILRNLKEISAGRTPLTIAHRLSAIQDADLIAVLARGRVIEQGDHATLLARDGMYAEMWRSQQSNVLWRDD